MKHAPIRLIYHKLHRRPLAGNLPLFFILAVFVQALFLCMVGLKHMESEEKDGKLGEVYYRNDELMRFIVRQSSALPLRLPPYADPSIRSSATEHDLPLKRKVGPLSPPPYTFATQAPDSATMCAEAMLALPPAAEPKEGGEP